jgi:hypothetical protein
MPPVLSGDIYLYGVFGRMVSAYGLNPYALPASAISRRFAWPLASWHENRSHYGPLWTLLSAGVTTLSGPSIVWSAVGFKAIAAASHLACGGLVLIISRRLNGGDGLIPALLFLWNPVALLESAGSGHNDTTMAVLVLAGLALLLSEHRKLGALALTLAILVKFLPLVVLGFVAVAAAHRATGLRAKTIALAAPFAVLTVVGGLLYAPFLAGADFLQPISGYVDGYFSTPLRVGLLALVEAALEGRADPATVVELSRRIVSNGLTCSFALVVGGLTLRFWRVLDWSRVIGLWAISALFYVGSSTRGTSLVRHHPASRGVLHPTHPYRARGLRRVLRGRTDVDMAAVRGAGTSGLATPGPTSRCPGPRRDPDYSQVRVAGVVGLRKRFWRLVAVTLIVGLSVGGWAALGNASETQTPYLVKPARPSTVLLADASPSDLSKRDRERRQADLASHLEDLRRAWRRRQRHLR